MPATTAVDYDDDDPVTSRTITRCSCSVGCPCCGQCVEAPSVSSTSWPPLPASSIAALRDVDSFIAKYQVSPPPPLIHSPPTLISDSSTRTIPLSTTQLESSVSPLSCRTTLMEDSEELTQPIWGTAAQLLDYQSNVYCYSQLQQKNYESESITETGYWSLNSSVVPAVAPTACSTISSSTPDMQDRSADTVTAYNNISLEHPMSYPTSSQLGYTPSPYVPSADGWNTDGQSLDERGALLASAVKSFSTNVSESALPPTDRTVHQRSSEVDRNALTPTVSTEPPRTSVVTLAQQLETFWAQRSKIADESQSAVQHNKDRGVRVMSRPTAPPPAPPGALTSANAYFERSTTEYDEQLTTQTLPRAASTRSLQAAPPRPPPRTTTHDCSTLLGRSLPPEPSHRADTQMSFDRISLCQGQMTTFHSQRTLKESSGHCGLSGSVQSLPGCDMSATSLTGATTTLRGRPAPQPPRRGSSMSPRLQTKSTRYGGRARSSSLRSNDDDVDDDDLLQRLTGSSSSASATIAGQRLGTSVPTTNVAARETSRQATVSGQKPVAQIRPHAIRSPSASSITRHRFIDDGDSKCSAVARTYLEQHTPVQAQEMDVQSSTFDSAGMSSDHQGVTPSNTSVSRFGTLRSRIRDYVTAAAGVGTNRKQQMLSSSSSSFADWTLPRGRQQGVARRSSSATSWEPDHSDYASSGNDGRASVDDSAGWSSSSYFGVFPVPRPFPSPRTRATEVSLPQHIVASADSSMSAADVTSSITSRINTFLTFLGGSRRPAGTSPTSDTPAPTTSATLRHGSSSTVNAGTGRLSTSVSETRTAAKAIVDPIVSTLGRQSRSVSSSPPVRSASTSEMLAKAAAAAAAAARDARGRQPLRFVREQRTVMSTFRNSGSLNVSVARSSSFSPHSTPAAQHSPPSADGSQLSDGRRTSKSGTLHDSAGSQAISPAQFSPKHLPSVARYAHQSAPSTPLDWNDGSGTQRTMTASLPVDNFVIRPSQIDSDESLVTTKETARTCPSSTVPLSVFRQADVEVERLIELLQNAAVPDDSPSGRGADRNEAQVEAARESLLALTRQFVDDSQRLVSSATRSVDALVAGVEPSLITLIRLAGECQSTASLLSSPSQGVMLVGRVRDLAQAYRSTVSATQSAVGRPFNSMEMKSLMRQATSLAAILSSLIKMLNRADIIC